MRVNARLDEELTEKMNYLKKQTQQNYTDILRSAIEHYHEQVQHRAKNKLELFRECGLIGCGEGPSDLSENYKEYLTQSLDKKVS